MASIALHMLNGCSERIKNEHVTLTPPHESCSICKEVLDSGKKEKDVKAGNTTEMVRCKRI